MEYQHTSPHEVVLEKAYQATSILLSINKIELNHIFLQNGRKLYIFCCLLLNRKFLFQGRSKAKRQEKKNKNKTYKTIKEHKNIRNQSEKNVFFCYLFDSRVDLPLRHISCFVFCTLCSTLFSQHEFRHFMSAGVLKGLNESCKN